LKLAVASAAAGVSKVLPRWPSACSSERVADKIEAGMVFVNAVGAEGVELPFGGVKRSGFGRELGRFGIDEFVNKKLIRIAG
jgi:succinate-semialdehyde dehydrogenase/glutarate-semialdehyde dehydrogenase